MTTEQLPDDTLDAMRSADLYEHAVDHTIEWGDSLYLEALSERIADLRPMVHPGTIYAEVMDDAARIVGARYRTWAGK